MRGTLESTDAMANSKKVPNAGNFDAFTAKFSPMASCCGCA